MIALTASKPPPPTQDASPISVTDIKSLQISCAGAGAEDAAEDAADTSFSCSSSLSASTEAMSESESDASSSLSGSSFHQHETEQPQQQQPRQSRAVRFAKQAKLASVVLIPCRSELSQKTVSVTWYSDDDYRQIRRDVKHLVKKFKATGATPDGNDDSDDNGDTETFRGLEHKTPKGMKQRQKNRYMSIDIVLDEQERHFEKQLHDTSCRSSRSSGSGGSVLDTAQLYISTMYQQSTRHCARAAHEAALKDERYVLQHVRNDDSSDEVQQLLRRHCESQVQRRRQNQQKSNDGTNAIASTNANTMMLSGRQGPPSSSSSSTTTIVASSSGRRPAAINVDPALEDAMPTLSSSSSSSSTATIRDKSMVCVAVA
eukprot:CAMPEP_0119561164 /NCGR_PEP_ID=MMETSP1352-20130426/16891_1 /TAXON_ID=265584 /ORGANISM="Stauroneis constricta, Strain CCMP1120" /LENGTH=372 /DNA_ID=CAMNT_0007609319 /DNA_START=107 /DNA_END=1225 /DNA_ORIENTATION=+